MTLVEILCNRTRICRAADVSHNRYDAPLFPSRNLVRSPLFGHAPGTRAPSICRFCYAREQLEQRCERP